MSKTRPRGRPLKFGRPSQVLAVTLPVDVIRRLRAVNPDVARAIVTLASPRLARERTPPRRPLELSPAMHGGALILVDAAMLPELPGCTLVRVASDRALIALEPGQGPAELEILVIDRLAARGVTADERTALRTLRRALRKWRRDQRVKVYPRSVVVIEGA